MCDALAGALGVTFKAEKDEGLNPEEPRQVMDWIGFRVDTRGEEVRVTPQPEKLKAIYAALTEAYETGRAKIGDWEKLLGRLAHVGQVYRSIRSYVRPLYKPLTWFKDVKGRIKNKKQEFNTHGYKQDILALLKQLAQTSPQQFISTFQVTPYASLRARNDYIEVSSDASGERGYGAHCIFGAVQGVWEG